MGYYVVKSQMTFRELYITCDEKEAKSFKYNYEYSHYGTPCEINYIDQKFEEFPKVLFVEAAGCYTINNVGQYAEDGYNWIYDYKAPPTPLEETDSFMLSKDTVKILRNEVHTKVRKQNTDLTDMRYYIEYYIKSIVGESPKELQVRIKSTTEDIIKKNLMDSGVIMGVK